MRKTALSSSAPSPWGTNYRSNINIRLPFVHKIHFTKPLTVSYTLRGTSSLTYCRLRLVLVLPRERMPGRNFTHVFQTPSIPSRKTCGSLISRQHLCSSCLQVRAKSPRMRKEKLNNNLTAQGAIPLLQLAVLLFCLSRSPNFYRKLAKGSDPASKALANSWWANIIKLSLILGLH
jgi:hypothetical protein